MLSRQELISFFALSLATSILALPLSVSPRTTSSSQGLSSSSSTDHKLLLTRAEPSDYNTIGQQLNNPNELPPFDPVKHRYSYPAPQRIPSQDRPSSNPINPAESRTSALINVHNDRRQQATYPSSVPKPESLPLLPPLRPTSYPKFASHQSQQLRHRLRTPPPAVPIAGSSTSLSASTRRAPLASTSRTSSTRHAHQSDAIASPPEGEKKTIRYTETQTNYLKTVLALTKSPDPEQKAVLVRTTGLTREQINRWFQNGRAHQKLQLTGQRRPRSSRTGTKPSSATSSHPSTSQQR